MTYRYCDIQIFPNMNFVRYICIVDYRSCLVSLLNCRVSYCIKQQYQFHYVKRSATYYSKFQVELNYT